MNQGRKRPVAVEDLLALKRAERPPAEFWADFDRQLRAKQLAALVEKRPWWREVSFAGLFSGLRRYHLPLGATAVAAVTLVSFRLNQTSVTIESAQVPEVKIATEATAAAAPMASQLTAGHESSTPAAATTIPPIRQEIPAEIAVASASESAASGVARLIPLLGVPADDFAEAGGIVSMRQGDAGLGSTTAQDAVVFRTLLDSSGRFENRVTPVTKLTVEPLHQITPPSGRRGSRILTAMVSMSSVESAMRTTERVASRLSEEQLYDQIHRFGARGAGVNVKF